MNVLISACLLGLACRYDGKGKTYAQIDELLQEKNVVFIPFCPEQAGGLTTPRDPAERQGEKVMTCTGRDVTDAYRRGAEQALYMAKKFGCDVAVLKEKSPSCGCGTIYDGSFSRRLVSGDGVTAERLKNAGMIVVGESRAKDLFAQLPD